MIIENIKLFYKNYKVQYFNEIRNDEDVKLAGQINYQTSIIKINNTLDEIEQKLTLLHEIVHGIDEKMNIGLEEKQVDNIANGLITVLIDNPEFAKLFMKGEE